MKYRIRDKEDNCFIEDECVVNGDGLVCWPCPERGIVEFSNQEKYIIERTSELFDKNNNEIYDGDMLKVYISQYPDNRTTNFFITKVWFEDGMFCTHTGNKTNNYWSLSDTISYYHEIEIIGNIHES
jgi:uncharacterized phage protein (TIGR01671 family)